MNISPREKMIAIGVAAVIGLYVLDSFLLSPMLARLADANDHYDADSLTLAQANNTFQSGTLASAMWRKMSENRIGADASAAQSKLLNHVGDVARSTGMTLSSIKPEHGEKAQGFARTGLRASGATNMATLTAFLLKIQSADIPIRVTDLQIKANKPGIDDLTVDLGISTIYKLTAAEEAK